MLEHFLRLPEQRQADILNAAMGCFGQNGYRKASAADISQAAGISKAMVFYYFGSKKKLYLYLLGYSARLIEHGILESADPQNNDFFERIRLATHAKLDVLRRHPPVFAFLAGACLETDESVHDEVREFFESSEGARFRDNLVLRGIDVSRFKPGVDPSLVYTMLLRIGYGYLNGSPGWIAADCDGIQREFEAILTLLKKNLYRPEALKGEAP